MKKEIDMRWNSSGVLAAMAVGLGLGLAMSGRPTVSADNDGSRGCSNRTLRGDYGFSISGTIFPPSPVPSFLLRGVSRTHFDGHGNSSSVDFVTRNGIPIGTDWRETTGTYELNEDCTGTAEFTPNDGSPTVHLRMVVVDGGRQIFNTVEGNSTGGVGMRLR